MNSSDFPLYTKAVQTLKKLLFAE